MRRTISSRRPTVTLEREPLTVENWLLDGLERTVSELIGPDERKDDVG